MRITRFLYKSVKNLFPRNFCYSSVHKNKSTRIFLRFYFSTVSVLKRIIRQITLIQLVHLRQFCKKLFFPTIIILDKSTSSLVTVKILLKFQHRRKKTHAKINLLKVYKILIFSVTFLLPTKI